MKKVNPRRKPATFADVEKARQEAFTDAIEMCWAIYMTVLYDKEHAQVEDIQRVWGEIEDLSKSITDGYCNVNDLKNVLKTEYGVNLK